MEKVQNFKNAELVNEDFGTAKLPKIRDEFIAKLENALMFLDYKELSIWHSEAKNKVNLRNFDGAWLMDVSLKHNKDEEFTFSPFGDLQVTPDMFPKLNMKMMNLSGDVAHLSKYRFLNTKEKRHLQNYKYIFSERFGFLDYGKQKWWTNEDGYGFNTINKTDKGVNYVLPMPTSLKNGYVLDKKQTALRIYEDIENPDSMYFFTMRNFHMALQLALTYDYEWSCYIKEKPDSLGIRIPIHPSSSKEIFMMRNIPEGRNRKTAIVNFVKEHYRTLKNDNEEEKKVLIKKHLRGDLKFNWRGLEVHITPSPFDLRKTKTTKNFLKFD